MNKVAIFLADGFEEIEGLTVVDLLRRCDIEITMVSIMDGYEVVSAHNIKVVADKLFDEVTYEDYDMLVLPGGGGGTQRLSGYEPLLKLINSFNEQGKKLAAICAAPSVLGKCGVLNNRRACAYPGFEEYLVGAQVTNAEVEADGNVITSRGMGCSIPFALAIVESFLGSSVMEELKKTIIYEQR